MFTRNPRNLSNFCTATGIAIYNRICTDSCERVAQVKKCPFINRVLVKSAHHQFLPKNNNTSLKFMRINKIIDYQRKNTLIFYKILSTNILRKHKRDRSVRRIFFQLLGASPLACAFWRGSLRLPK